MITLELFEHWLAQAPAGHQLIVADLEGGSIEVLARRDPEKGAIYQRALNEQARGRILVENNNFGTVAIMRKAQGDSPMATHELPQRVSQPIPQKIPRDGNFAETNYDLAEAATSYKCSTCQDGDRCFYPKCQI
jgi:hypothetical protein